MSHVNAWIHAKRKHISFVNKNIHRHELNRSCAWITRACARDSELIFSNLANVCTFDFPSRLYPIVQEQQSRWYPTNSGFYAAGFIRIIETDSTAVHNLRQKIFLFSGEQIWFFRSVTYEMRFYLKTTKDRRARILILIECISFIYFREGGTFCVSVQLKIVLIKE